MECAECGLMTEHIMLPHGCSDLKTGICYECKAINVFSPKFASMDARVVRAYVTAIVDTANYYCGYGDEDHNILFGEMPNGEVL